MRRVTQHSVLFLGISLLCEIALGYNILMATMGGTKSHTVPFVALGTSLRSRGHNVTLLSAFSGPAANNGLHELVPSILEVTYDTPYKSFLTFRSIKPHFLKLSRTATLFRLNSLSVSPLSWLLHFLTSLHILGIIITPTISFH